MRTLTKTFLAFCLISLAASPTYAFGFMKRRCCRPVVVPCCCPPVHTPCCRPLQLLRCRPLHMPCCPPVYMPTGCCSAAGQYDAIQTPAAPSEEHAGESEAPEAAVEEAPVEA